MPENTPKSPSRSLLSQDSDQASRPGFRDTPNRKSKAQKKRKKKRKKGGKKR